MTQPKQKTVYIKEKTNDWVELFLAIGISAAVAVVGTVSVIRAYHRYNSVNNGTAEYYHDKFLNKQYREKSHEDLCENCKARANEEELQKQGYIKGPNGFWYHTNQGVIIYGNTIK